MTLKRKLQILTVLVLLAVLAGLRACYWVGKADETLQANPPASKKEVTRWKSTITALKAKVQVAARKQDSAVRVADHHEARAVKSQHQADSLTQLYEQVPAAAARRTDAELFDHLVRYRPSPFPDTLAN